MYLKNEGIAFIEEGYKKKIIPDIKEAFKREKSSFSVDFLTALTKGSILDSCGTLNDGFLEDLLTQPLEELAVRWNWVRMVYCYERERKKWRNICRKKEVGKRTYYTKKRLEYLERYNIDVLVVEYPVRSVTPEQVSKSDREMSELLKAYKTVFLGWNDCLNHFIKYEMIDADLKIQIKQAFHLEVCPYCNRQYITSFQASKKQYVTADLDHFYPQSKFPLLALSLYNLVPACLVCNRLIKRDSFGNIWNPYRAGFADMVHFEVDNPQNVNALIGNNDEFTLRLKNDASEDDSDFEVTENTIQFFELEEIYQSHKHFVRELLYKKHAYNETYLRELQDIFRKAGIGRVDSNLILYGFEMDKTKIGERILGKLTFDIVGNA